MNMRIKNARILILFMLVGAVLSPAAFNALEQSTLQSYLEKGTPFDFILIDVRGVDEISTGIGNAACKPYNLAWPEQFKKECARIPKDRKVIVYCRSGARAARAAEYLDASGFANVYNAGGFLTWTGPTIPQSEFKPVALLPAPSMQSKTGRATSR
jgi:rhodanese-related sulfurtransferase